MVSVRVSRSRIDPLLAPAVPRLLAALNLPRSLPPEILVLCGHAIAWAGCVAFALAPRSGWFGLAAALTVALNHVSDLLDGAHARATGQCRNGGEMLDHVLDPLSFCAWLLGLGVAADRPWLAVAATVSLQALALVTSIQAKMTGEFRLSRVGPTEFKALLVVFGLSLAAARGFGSGELATALSRYGLAALAAALWVSFVAQLVLGVKRVNARGGEPDRGEWRIRGS